MADETPVNAPAAQPVATAPGSAAPSATPAPTATSAPAVAPVEAPKVEASAPAVVAAEAPKADAPKPADTSLLGAELKAEPAKEPAKTETQPVVEGEKKAEGSQSEQAPLPTYEFTLPEGISLDKEKLGTFQKELGDFQLKSKADQAAMQEFGQKLVDRYVAETNETIQRLNEHYTNAFEKQKSDWKTSFESDPEIGGAKKEATLKSALEFIQTHGGTKEQQAEFRTLMNQTGMGNHPAMIRMFAKAMSAMREGGPVPAPKPAVENKSKVAKRYGST